MLNVEKLRELADLHRQGAITQEEFDKAKHELLTTTPPAPPVATLYPERAAELGTWPFAGLFIAGLFVVMAAFGIPSFETNMGAVFASALYWSILPGYVGWRKGHSFWLGYFVSWLITPLLATVWIAWFAEPEKPLTPEEMAARAERFRQEKAERLEKEQGATKEGREALAEEYAQKHFPEKLTEAEGEARKDHSAIVTCGAILSAFAIFSGIVAGSVVDSSALLGGFVFGVVLIGVALVIGKKLAKYRRPYDALPAYTPHGSCY